MTLSGSEGISQVLRTFAAADYVVFALMLLVCVLVGVYYGFYAKQITAEDYLMGGRNMKLIPIALSLIATLISSSLLIGMATDTYLNGVQYVYSCVSIIFSGSVITYIFLPVMHDLKLVSIYEYLEMRFNRSTRLYASILFSLKMIMVLPVLAYLPAITFGQASGVDYHYIALLIFVVCLFYTCVGGLKAVVWSDVIQAFTMFGGMFLVVIKGTIDVGGPSVVWQRNVESGRIEPPILDPNPTLRYSFWGVAIGNFFMSLQACAFNQNMTQRYFSLPQLKIAKISVWMTMIGGAVFLVFSCYTGLLAYAMFYNCDPLTSKLLQAKDQVIPLMVMQSLGDYPGLPGIFVAGVFSASLSTLSSCLNSMAAVVLEDYYKAFVSKPLTERQTNIFMKSVVVILGLLGFGLVFVVEKLGYIVQAMLTIGVMADGPLVGMFVMGFLLPWVNSKGAFSGGLLGMAFIVWISMGNYAAVVSGRVRYKGKPLTVEGCTYNVTLPNVTAAAMSTLNESDDFILYRISYMWFVPLGCIVTILLGVLVSLVTGGSELRSINRKLLSNVVRRFLPKQKEDLCRTETLLIAEYQLVKNKEDLNEK